MEQAWKPKKLKETGESICFCRHFRKTLANYFEFRIKFSDDESIRLLHLIKPILESKKFQGVPKMIITQFCRGTFMNNSLSATDEFESPTKCSKPVNSQASLFSENDYSV